MHTAAAILLMILGDLACAQRQTAHEGRPALVLENDTIALTILTTGGSFAALVLKDDPQQLNPLWDPARMARQSGGGQRFGAGTGHFLCLDGFGPPSKEEQAAGLPGHGEAVRQPWTIVASSATEITFEVALPLVQEQLKRRVRLAPKAPVISVASELSSLAAFDRVIMWAEHGTIGAPFLSLGRVAVDASSTECRTKPYASPSQLPRTLPSGLDFRWPVVATPQGGVNLRVSPREHNRMDHVGCLMDPAREHQFLTALNTEHRLLFGYWFSRQDYPWVQHWMYYPPNGAYAWGLEFGMQPYDMSKRDLLALQPMFGHAVFRWLPAKTTIATRFLMFLTRVPQGFARVDDVRRQAGRLVFVDRSSGLEVTLEAPEDF